MKLKSYDNSLNRGILFQLIRWSLAGILIISIPLAVTSYIFKSDLKNIMRHQAIQFGYGQMGNKDKGYEKFLQFSYVWLKSFYSKPDIPQITIDIKLKHFNKLKHIRRKALEIGVLRREEDDSVPATIRYKDRSVPVELRLKGDLTSHLDTDKWSYRVHIKDGRALFGMKRFSLQHPKVRTYHGELLFFETLKHLNLITSRYFFTNVTVNGDNIGIMALAEHFSTELLENNRLKESVIIRFDESFYWNERVAKKLVDNSGDYDDFRKASIDTYNMEKIRKSASLSDLNKIAIGLMRGYVEGTLSANDVFDIKKLGQHFAVAEFWGAWHDMHWKNLRFMLNPYTLKLEPIAYDAKIYLRFPVGKRAALHIERLQFAKFALKNQAVFDEYLKALHMISEDILNESLLKKLINVEEKHLSNLQSEFFLLRSFPWGELRQRAEYYQSLSKQSMLATAADDSQYINIMNAYIINDNNSSYLEIQNLIPFDISIQSVNWESKKGEYLSNFDTTSKAQFPFVVPASSKYRLPTTIKLNYNPTNRVSKPILKVVASIKGSQKKFVESAKVYYSKLTKHPIPQSTIDEQLRKHPFLTFKSDANELHVKPGIWTVDTSIIVPQHYSLHLSPSTTLHFAEQAALIARGPVFMNGDPNLPVVLEGANSNTKDASWQGIVLLNTNHLSKWQHVIVRNTKGISIDGWKLAGGTNFYSSDIAMDNVVFSSSQAEEAISIVQSEFTLNRIVVRNALFDGLDAEFSNGTVKQSTFENIGKAGGGDGVDISGSTVDLDNIIFNYINDKAISVGEESVMNAKNITMKNVGTGAVSKDGSSLTINNSTITDARNAGLMAYIKKNQYPPAQIIANQFSFSGSSKRAYAQLRSRIVIDGLEVEASFFDTEELYNTIMKKGSKQ